MAAKEIFQIYDTVFSSPGMSDNVRIDMRVSRKNVLLLSRLIEKGLGANAYEKDEIFTHLSKDTIEELENLRAEILKKAGLTEFSEKLKSL